MRSAMDSAFCPVTRAALMFVGLVAAGCPLGCARLQEYRKQDHPILGKLSAKPAKPDKKASRPPDLYAQALKAKAERDGARASELRSGPEAEAADESLAAARRNRDEERDLHSSDAPVVALERPIPLEDRPVLASNTQTVPDRLQPKDPSEGSDRVEAVVAASRARIDAMMSYQVQLHRQERVSARLLPEEDVLLSIRRSPKAVRLEWPDGPNKGREVLYSASEEGGLMHVNTPGALIPQVTMRIDSPLVMSNSRHPITEAGFDMILQQIESALQLEKAGTPIQGKVQYAGLEKVDGLDQPCHKLRRVTPAGETWLVYIDPQTKLPALVQANAADGALLERYAFRDVVPDVAELSQAGAFDAKRRWGESKGLLSRIAGSAGAADKPDTATR